ncbi:Non-reducing polyketide synthase pyr2 [Trichinella spiralis]|uniref:Non-reducing polyketide synthase pyr2 n=1 Tax=Trichinella spiralis TaxID=6334 RepID=A0ABR3KVE6_TRISP
MANMPGVGLEIFKAGGGWRDQKWAPSWSVKLPSLRQGRVQTLPCSLGRQSARSPSLERGKPRLSALKRRVRLSCFTCLRCAGSLVFSPLQGRGRYFWLRWGPAPLALLPRIVPPPSPAPETPTASSPLSSRAVLHDFFQDDPVGSGNPIRRRRSPAPDGVRC